MVYWRSVKKDKRKEILTLEIRKVRALTQTGISETGLTLVDITEKLEG